MTVTYVTGQIDVRDTLPALLDYFGAPVSATAARLPFLPVDGRDSSASIPPQPAPPLHLRPAAVVGRLDDYFLRLLPLFPSGDLL